VSRVPENAAHQLQRTVDEITGYSRRTRKLVLGLAVTTVLGIAIAAFVAFLYVRLHDSQVSACAGGNQTREQQARLWRDVVGLAVGPHPAPAGMAFRQKTLQDVAKTYAPVDCDRRYPFW
jgi:hypothetical protein